MSSKTSVETNAKPARTQKAARARPTQAGGEPESIGKAHAAPTSRGAAVAPQSAATGTAGSERALDGEREGGPRYGGGAWGVADERGDARYGHARNDDGETAQATSLNAEAAPGELAATPDAELAAAAADIEGSGQHAGMGHGEKPRKTKSEKR
ncbi:MAG: hypothetical protein ABIY55_35380 [Kofleriaceae bacterium]